MNQMTPIIAAPITSFTARFTTAEFLRMVKLGAFEDWKVELVEGELHRTPPPGNDHSRVQIAVIAGLLRVASEALVRGETGIDLGDDTVIGCDVALLNEPLVGRQMIRPVQVAVVVEVAESSRARDLDLKRRLYAGAGIGCYWVVDGSRAVVHVHTEPTDGDYANVRTVRFGEPLAVPGTDATITLS